MIEPDDDALLIGRAVKGGFQYIWPLGTPYPLLALVSATIYEQLNFPSTWGRDRLIEDVDRWLADNPERWRP